MSITVEHHDDTTAVAVVAASDAVKATTTYLGFNEDHELPGSFHFAGEITVLAGRADKAKQHFLEMLAAKAPDRAEYSVAVTPKRGWQQETFVPAPPEAPRFVPKG